MNPPSDCVPKSHKPTYVMCKWNSTLAESLISRARLHFILDQYDIDHSNPDPELLLQAASVHQVRNFNSLEELGTIAAELWLTDPQIDGVISFTEFSQLGALVIRSVLGLSPNPIRELAARDKRLMKRLVSEAGVRAAHSLSLPDPGNTEAVRVLASQIAFPAIIKPAAGSGTEHTTKVADLTELLAATQSFSSAEGVDSRQMIVEEYIAGDELHVDACWKGEEPVYFFVAQNYTPRLECINADVTDGSRLINPGDEPDLYENLLEMNRAANRALNTGQTMTHMEVFRMRNGTLVFSEMATRIGGGLIPALLSQAMGQTVWRVVAEATLGIKSAEAKPTASYLAALHIRAEEPGTVIAVPSESDFSHAPGLLDYQILCNVGDELVMESASEWCVFVVIGAEDSGQLDERVSWAQQHLRVETRASAHQ